MESKVHDVSTPLETDSGKIIWHKIGTYFKNYDDHKKYVGVIHLNSIPIGASAPLKLFIYPRQARKQEPKIEESKNQFDNFMGDEVPF